MASGSWFKSMLERVIAISKGPGTFRSTRSIQSKVLGDLLALHDFSNLPFLKPIMQYVVDVIIAF